MARITQYTEDNAFSEWLSEKEQVSVTVYDETMGATLEVKVDAGDVLRRIGQTFEPGDVFDERKLGEWALANGFVRS